MYTNRLNSLLYLILFPILTVFTVGCWDDFRTFSKGGRGGENYSIPLPIFTPPSTQIFPLNQPIDVLTLVNNGEEAITCESQPALPSGLSISVYQGTCRIQGTPTVLLNSVTDYTIRAKSESSGSTYASTNLPIIITEPFVSLWKTDNPGTSANNQVMLPLHSQGSYNFKVDWGDGSPVEVINSYSSSYRTHTYAAPGTYTITIYGLITGWQFDNSGDKDKILEISEWGNFRLGNMGSYFYGASNLVINTIEPLNLTGTTSLFRAFRGCTSLASIGGAESWDTSGITNMRETFAFATLFNQDISMWNTSSLTNLNGTFTFATNFNQNIGLWDVSNVTIMGSLFDNAINFNQDITGWNTSNVTNMGGIFASTLAFNQDIGGWDVSNVDGMRGAFYEAEAFNQDISGWDVSSVTTMEFMFKGATLFNQDISGWDVSNVTNMIEMFYEANAFNQNIGIWDVSSVTTMAGMFFEADNFDQDLGAWDVRNVTDMSDMFLDAGLSTPNYDSLLIGWSILPLRSNVNFHGGDSTYSVGAAAARASIIGTFGWTIDDGGPE